MQNNALEDRLLTPKEAGIYLGLAEGTIRNKASRGEIPFVKVGVSLRFRKSALDRIIQDGADPASEAEGAESLV